MGIANQFDREVEHLEEQLENGEISSKEYDNEMRDIRRAAKEAAQEAAQAAYDDAMGLW